ncbi:MAG: flagellar export protein FliJ [Lachnospiraceae bacterium]|nr:flagellar export protein FliJ [Lachnospiraceae bacterium]
MAKFNYRLQNILNLMVNFEEQAKQNFAERRRILSDEEERLENLTTEQERLEKYARELRTGDIDIKKIIENKYEQKYVEDEIKKQKVKVNVARKNLEAARVRMEDAVKERKIHEKLRENAFEYFMEEESAKELMEIDGLTSYVYGIKNGNS